MIRQWFCNHRSHGYDEIAHGPIEDDPGGPVTMHYISWRCRGCEKTIGDPLDRNDSRPSFRAADGFVWRKVEKVWRQVCDTCGGNCGQCGITGRIGNIAPSMDYLIVSTGMNNPPAGLRR